MFGKQTIKETSLERSTVLVRADYNVPLTDGGLISDDFRIRTSLPTLRYLKSQGCRVVIMSHLGRPEGQRSEEFSLRAVATRLSEYLHQDVTFVEDCVGESVEKARASMAPGDILLLENLRFHPEEEANDIEFAKQIVQATRARFFVQDGFGVVHRAHASTDAVTKLLPSVAGLLLDGELKNINKAIESPARPFYAVLGGAKVSDKIEVIESFVQKADRILIGGAMANTFLKYKGYSVGKSKVEDGKEDVIRSIYEAAAAKVGQDKVDEFIVLPVDVAVSGSIAGLRRTVKLDQVPDEDMILDVGDETIELFAEELTKAKTIIWNGTLGVADKLPFSHGSARVALAMATNKDATTVIGGGDTADFAIKWSDRDTSVFTHVSTGGGASLELMSGRELPGVVALRDKPE